MGAVVLGCTTPGNAHGVRRSQEVDELMAKGEREAILSALVSPGWVKLHPEYLEKWEEQEKKPIPEYARRLHYLASEEHDCYSDSQCASESFFLALDTSAIRPVRHILVACRKFGMAAFGLFVIRLSEATLPLGALKMSNTTQCTTLPALFLEEVEATLIQLLVSVLTFPSSGASFPTAADFKRQEVKVHLLLLPPMTRAVSYRLGLRPPSSNPSLKLRCLLNPRKKPSRMPPRRA